METSDLHARLAQLEQHLAAADAHLRSKATAAAPHQDKATALRQQYDALSYRVKTETADAEAHGHHVSDLERAVRAWIDSFGLKSG